MLAYFWPEKHTKQLTVKDSRIAWLLLAHLPREEPIATYAGIEFQAIAS